MANPALLSFYPAQTGQANCARHSTDQTQRNERTTRRKHRLRHRRLPRHRPRHRAEAGRARAATWRSPITTATKKRNALCKPSASWAGSALAVQADVSDPESVAEAFADVSQAIRRVDIVVSNAAIGVLQARARTDAQTLAALHGNERARVEPARATSGAAHAHGGRIIGISSLGASRAIPHTPSSARPRRRSNRGAQPGPGTGPHGIRVNTVSAGVVDTDALKYFPESRTIARRNMPAARRRVQRSRRKTWPTPFTCSACRKPP